MLTACCDSFLALLWPRVGPCRGGGKHAPGRSVKAHNAYIMYSEGSCLASRTFPAASRLSEVKVTDDSTWQLK